MNRVKQQYGRVHHRMLLLCLLFLCTRVIHADGGYISGTVRDHGTGQPIDNMRIRIYDEQWNFEYSESAWTAPDGTYISGELSSGKYYVRAVSIYPQPWVTQYWFGTSDKDTAIPIQVSAGETIVGVDFNLDRGGYIRGVVRDTGSHPLVDVDLDVYDGEWSYIGTFTDRTDDTGNYILGPLSPGMWYVRADPDRVHGVCQAYWPDAWYREDARVLSVAADEDIPGVDFELQPGSSVTGRITWLRNSEPFTGCGITLFTLEGREQPLHSVTSVTDGSYVAFGIPAGDYIIMADAPWGCGARDTYYPDAADSSQAIPVSVETATTVDGINIALPEGNFDINIGLSMPRRWVDPGELFGLKMIVDNDGPVLPDLPVFLILDIQGALYFWPSWSLWAPPEALGFDYLAFTVPEDTSEIIILPEFIWPQLGFDMDGLQFIGAMTNWSITALASDVEVEEWSFDGYP